MIARFTPFIKAILYADIFDFPLTKEEVWKFAIGQSAKKDFEQFLSNPPAYIKEAHGYFYLAERKNIIRKRPERQKASKRKLLIAQKASALLAKIPTIQCIGISGGLSLLNADTKDDIDFFIITKKNTIWITRFFVALLLELFGKRRKRGKSKATDSICVNMYLTEDNLAFSKTWRDLYLAHEVIQVMPLFSRGNTYEKFVSANAWVGDFLPNALDRETTQNYTQNNAENWFSAILCAVLRFSAFEFLAKHIQLWYMKKHRTRESVSDTMLAFHPIDYRGKTLSAFLDRVRKYEQV